MLLIHFLDTNCPCVWFEQNNQDNEYRIRKKFVSLQQEKNKRSLINLETEMEF